MQNPLLKIIHGDQVGIPSYCTANEIVIEALLEQAANLNTDIQYCFFLNSKTRAFVIIAHEATDQE